jgi:3-chloro-4-hydroxyphenylacetate reductive dehalogenase
MAVESETPPRAHFDPTRDAQFGLPDLGRTVRVVGTVVNVDPEDTPHPMVRRGAVGKALFDYARNTVAVDPIARTNSPFRSRDQGNYFTASLRQAADGAVNSRRTNVEDPAAMTRHIKRVGLYLGADIVGIGKSHPSLLYGGGALNDGGYTVDRSDGAETPQELCRKFPYVIVTPVAWDYALGQAHRHHIGDAAYDTTLMQTILVLTQLERYIKELGYTALRGKVNPQAAALAGGVGELGRNGLIITEKFGARIHLNDAILTDLPLAPDKPIDLGVDDFCKICRKCAETCPTNSITFEDKQVFNGIEKYKIKWETCYKLRPLVAEHWNVCLTCSTVCPYTKPNTWWRTLALRTLTTTPIPVRPVVVRGLKWLDDRIWGKTANRRVRWLGYDSGVKPGVKACTVAGCSAQHGEAVQPIDLAASEKIGYYAPLKENVNRFTRRS